MSASVRLAGAEDMIALQKLDSWPEERVWLQKFAAGEVMVLELDGSVVSLMRYDLLWTTVPFLGLTYIKAAYRGQSYSRMMLEFFKAHLREQGYIAFLSSLQANEPEAQRWHLRGLLVKRRQRKYRRRRRR